MAVALVAGVLALGWAPSAIASTSYAVVGSINLGHEAWHSLAVDSTHHAVFVPHGSSNLVSVTDTDTNTVKATIPVADPSYVAVDPGLNRAYVTSGKSVAVIDTDSDTVISSISAPFTTASLLGIAVDPTTHKVYVADYGDDIALVIDPTSDPVAISYVGQFARGGQPVGVGVDPTTHLAYVGVVGTDQVEVIDGTTVTHVLSTRDPGNITVDPSTGQVYAGGPLRVDAIDMASNTVTATLPVGTQASNVAVDPSTHIAYVGNAGDHTVSVIDQTTNTLVATVPVGTTQPSAVDVDPATHRAYVLTYSGVVWVIAPRASQAISFTSTAPSDARMGDHYTVAATGGGSANPVTFSIDPTTTNAACSITGSTVSFDHPGACVLAADQAGNSDYTAAPTATQQIAVGAGPPPVISAIDTTTAGHASGTVTTSRPYVRVQLGTSGSQSDALPVTDGLASFDLPTWGYGTATVRAVGCASTTTDSCDTETAESPEFTPSDVTPTVTWPTSHTIAQNQTVKLTVDDPEGGGALRAVWIPDDSNGRRAQQDVSRSGQTSLGILQSSDTDDDGVGDTSQVDDGLGTLVLQRCAAALAVDPNHCHTLTTTDGAGTQQSLGARFEIDHSFYAIGDVSTPDALPNASTPTIGSHAQTLTIPVTISDPGTYQLSWSVVDWFGETQTWDQGTQTLNLSGTTTTLSLPIEPLGGGAYSVVTWLTRTSPAGGSFTTQILTTPSGRHPRFDVDDQGPSLSQLLTSTPELFPAPDHFRDTTGFTLTGQYEPWTDVTLSIANDATGAVVHTQSAGDHLHPPVGPTAPAGGDQVSFEPWDGTDATGHQVPAGWYTATAIAHDVYGNARHITSRLHVSAARLTRKTWSTTVSATGSRVASTVGRCSNLRAPASRRWSGSLLLGAGSRTKCKPRTAADRSVQTTNQVRLPALPAATYWVDPNTVEANPGHYDTLSISAYGGASTLKTKARSTAAIRWVSATNRLEAARKMSAALGNHPGVTGAAAGVLRHDRTVRFNTYATGLSSYDVKQYTLTMTYTALQ